MDPANGFSSGFVAANKFSGRLDARAAVPLPIPSQRRKSRRVTPFSSLYTLLLMLDLPFIHGCYFAILSSCHIVTDFFPSRSPALPFHTANATGTVVPGCNATEPCPLPFRVLRNITR